MIRPAPVVQRESRLQAIITRIVAAVVLLIGSYFVLTITNVCTIRCHSIVRGNPYECSIESSLGGFIALSEVKIEKARTADVEEKGSNSARVVISNDQKTITTAWLQSPYHSSKAVADEINEQFEFRSVTSFELFQVEAPPAILALVMLLAGIWLLLASVRKMIRK